VVWGRYYYVLNASFICFVNSEKSKGFLTMKSTFNSFLSLTFNHFVF
jgi:hypothetical protein